jgi:hypothetical protein
VDELLWVVDAPFGYPQRPLTHLFAAVPNICAICKVAYLSLPLTFVVEYLVLPARLRLRYLAAIAACGLVILPFYVTCPAAGPAYLFGDAYPDAIPALAAPHAHPLPANYLLNTTPSGHLAWVLLLFWFARQGCSRRVAAAFAVFGLLILIATLGLGEHYVIDLVVAIPFAAAIWSLTLRQWKRTAALLAFVAVWCVVLRQGWLIGAPPLLVWALSAATLASPLAGRLRFRLAPAPLAAARSVTSA